MKRKKLISFIIGIAAVLGLAGCSGELPDDLKSNMVNAFQNRAALNDIIAKDLHSSGIISDATYKLISDSITTSLTSFAESIQSANGESAKNLLKSCVGWNCVLDENGNISENQDFAEQYFTNFLKWADDHKEHVAKENVPALGGNSGNIKPIEVISESMVNQLNAELSIPVWVLKYDINSAEGLDGIVEAVKKAADDKSESGLAVYFEEAYYTDSNGTKQKLTLMDPTNPSEQMVKITTGSPLASSDTKITSTTAIDNTEGLGVSYDNLPGNDMIVTIGGEDIMLIRLVEFNQEAVTKLSEKIGLGEKRYLVLNNKAYLLEYPVGCIAGFTEVGNSAYRAFIEKSELGFNLLTGQFSKFTVSNGEITNQSVKINSDDPYLTYNGSKSNADESKASLVLYGETGVGDTNNTQDDSVDKPWNISFGTYRDSNGNEQKRIINTGRIVLRDYLEATYAPGIVGSDNLIVLGRKLRVLNLWGDKSTEVARFYDKMGNELQDNGAILFIDDFADVESLVSINPEVAYINRQGESISIDDNNTESEDSENNDAEDNEIDNSEDSEITGEEAIKDKDSEELKSSISKIDQLPTKMVTKVECSTKFPGKHIGNFDYSSTDDKPLFYAMAIKKSMFETGLFSGWVQSTDKEQNSTEWWNSWLDAHKYTYKINSNNLVNYLKGNYAYNLSQAGVIILDLETIGKIQQGYEAEDKSSMAKGLRTTFIVLGYILIVYSLTLLISWNVDVNVDLGFNILEKISFGKWVAVKDEGEMPKINSDGTSYVTFSRLIVSCLIIMSLGILLIVTNVVELIIALINVFSGVADQISKMITGR